MPEKGPNASTAEQISGVTRSGLGTREADDRTTPTGHLDRSAGLDLFDPVGKPASELSDIQAPDTSTLVTHAPSIVPAGLGGPAPSESERSGA
jgi:hypothetical protein